MGILAAFTITGCDQIDEMFDSGLSAPKQVTVDANVNVACSGTVTVSEQQQGQSFKVSFADVDGLWHVIWGVKRVEVADIPPLAPAPMPFNPRAPSLGDDAGHPYVAGEIYTWPDGTKAILKNGAWAPVMEPNPVCRRAPSG